MDNSTKPDPTKPETAAQHTGSADVSYGANTNLSPADVSETAAAQEIVEQHQTSGAQTSSAQSGVTGPSPEQTGSDKSER